MRHQRNREQRIELHAQQAALLAAAVGLTHFGDMLELNFQFRRGWRSAHEARLAGKMPNGN